MVTLKIENGVKVAYLTYPESGKIAEDTACEGAVDIFESFSDLKQAHPDWQCVNNRVWNQYSEQFI